MANSFGTIRELAGASFAARMQPRKEDGECEFIEGPRRSDKAEADADLQSLLTRCRSRFSARPCTSDSSDACRTEALDGMRSAGKN